MGKCLLNIENSSKLSPLLSTWNLGVHIPSTGSHHYLWLCSPVIYTHPCKRHFFLLPVAYSLVGFNSGFLPESKLWWGKGDHMSLGAGGNLKCLMVGDKTKNWQCNPNKNAFYRFYFVPGWLWKELSEEFLISLLRWVAYAYPKGDHNEICLSDSLSITKNPSRKACMYRSKNIYGSVFWGLAGSI